MAEFIRNFDHLSARFLACPAKASFIECWSMNDTLRKPKTALELVSDANRLIPILSVEELDAAMKSGDLVLLDVREKEEYELEAIPGALHASRGMLEFYADPTNSFHRHNLQPTQRVVLYCGTGGRSALAALSLKTLGYCDVAQLQGGFKAWKAAACSGEDRGGDKSSVW